MLSLYNISLSTTAESQEVWNIFWYLTNYFNGNLLVTGSISLSGYDSTGQHSNMIKPSQIAFGPTGHTHLGVHPFGLKKRHFDLNSLHTLWQDYFDEGVANPSGTGTAYAYHYCAFGGRVEVVVGGGTGVAELHNNFKSFSTAPPPDAEWGLDLLNIWFDDTAYAWINASYAILGAIVTSVNAIGDYDTPALYSYVYISSPPANKWSVKLIGDDGTWWVHYMIFVRYTFNYPME